MTGISLSLFFILLIDGNNNLMLTFSSADDVWLLFEKILYIILEKFFIIKTPERVLLLQVGS